MKNKYLVERSYQRRGRRFRVVYGTLLSRSATDAKQPAGDLHVSYLELVQFARSRRSVDLDRQLEIYSHLDNCYPCWAELYAMLRNSDQHLFGSEADQSSATSHR